MLAIAVASKAKSKREERIAITLEKLLSGNLRTGHNQAAPVPNDVGRKVDWFSLFEPNVIDIERLFICDRKFPMRRKNAV